MVKKVSSRAGVPLHTSTIPGLARTRCREAKWISARGICRRGLLGPQKSVERAARFEIETHGRFRTIDAVDKRTGTSRRA